MALSRAGSARNGNLCSHWQVSSCKRATRFALRDGKNTSVSAGEMGNEPAFASSATCTKPAELGHESRVVPSTSVAGPIAFAAVRPKVSGSWQPAQLRPMARLISCCGVRPAALAAAVNSAWKPVVAEDALKASR